MGYIFLAVSAVLITGFIVTYNKIVRMKFLVSEAFSGIDVQLKRRFDLLPALVETVKGYASYEQNLMEKITDIRGRVTGAKTITEKTGTENELTGIIKTLFAIAENYPDLKANTGFLDLQKNISEIEDQIQFARRYYNGAVRNYNIAIAIFPNNMVAAMFRFGAEEFFEIELAVRTWTPDAKLN
jgi:LemA protein